MKATLFQNTLFLSNFFHFIWPSGMGRVGNSLILLCNSDFKEKKGISAHLQASVGQAHRTPVCGQPCVNLSAFFMQSKANRQFLYSNAIRWHQCYFGVPSSFWFLWVQTYHFWQKIKVLLLVRFDQSMAQKCRKTSKENMKVPNFSHIFPAQKIKGDLLFHAN